MDNYFTHEKISSHITRIKDIAGTFFYLVEGSEKACLLDCGDGIGNLKKYVESICDKEIFLILTHGHLDHVGGAVYFDEVYINEKDLEIFKEHSLVEYRFNFISKQKGCENIKIEDLNPPFQKEFKFLQNNQLFDLGEVTIEMIEVSGHTPGMMCALIREDRTILFGDACGVFVLLFDKYSSTVSNYRNSLLNLKKYEKEYDYIIRNHGTGESGKSLLDNVIECCDEILSGTADNVPITFNGHNLLLCKKTDINNRRIDGKEGNIAYIQSLAE